MTETKVARPMAAALALGVSLLLLGCGGAGDENQTCTAARQYLASCLGKDVAVDPEASELCDGDSAEALLSTSCDTLLSAVELKADEPSDLSCELAEACHGVGSIPESACAALGPGCAFYDDEDVFSPDDIDEDEQVGDDDEMPESIGPDGKSDAKGPSCNSGSNNSAKKNYKACKTNVKNYFKKRPAVTNSDKANKKAAEKECERAWKNAQAHCKVEKCQKKKNDKSCGVDPWKVERDDSDRAKPYKAKKNNDQLDPSDCASRQLWCKSEGKKCDKCYTTKKDKACRESSQGMTMCNGKKCWCDKDAGDPGSDAGGMSSGGKCAKNKSKICGWTSSCKKKCECIPEDGKREKALAKTCKELVKGKWKCDGSGNCRCTGGKSKEAGEQIAARCREKQAEVIEDDGKSGSGKSGGRPPGDEAASGSGSGKGGAGTGGGVGARGSGGAGGSGGSGAGAGGSGGGGTGVGGGGFTPVCPKGTHGKPGACYADDPSKIPDCPSGSHWKSGVGCIGDDVSGEIKDTPKPTKPQTPDTCKKFDHIAYKCLDGQPAPPKTCTPPRATCGNSASCASTCPGGQAVQWSDGGRCAPVWICSN